VQRFAALVMQRFAALVVQRFAALVVQRFVVQRFAALVNRCFKPSFGKQKSDLHSNVTTQTINLDISKFKRLYYPTQKIPVVLEKLKVSIANLVFQILFCSVVDFSKMNFELATRVDDCTLEEMPAAVAAEEAEEIPAEEAEPAEVASEVAAEEAGPTGYQLSLCWCG
jgi:hypothetical protein